MVLDFVESADGITLGYPAWLALVCLGFAIACGYTALLRPAMWKERRWAGFVVTALLGWAGLHFGTYEGRFTPQGGRISAPFRSTVEVTWAETRAIRQQRSRAKGGVGQVIVASTSRGEFEFNTADLDAHSLDRLMRYIDKQIAASRGSHNG